METPGTDEPTEPETIKGTEEASSTRSSEDDLVLLIVILTFVFLIILGLYVWINRRSFGFEGPG
jgi:flagellar biogenesis protein FliO